MFKYVYPQFEKKRLLRGEMLDQLRDYPRNYLKMSFRGYDGGILTGCEITWDSKRITVAPGILLYKDNLYIMEEPYQAECLASDRLRYLKVQFLAEEKVNSSIMGNTRILLEEENPDPVCEIELCRFRLQRGARLRDKHESFEDFSTQYDTVDLIHAPYAAEGGTTLCPVLLKAFAGEMMRKESANTMDRIVSMNILSNAGRVSAGFIQAYVYDRTGEQSEGNVRLYRGLLEILKSQKTEESQKGRSAQNARSVMLL